MKTLTTYNQIFQVCVRISQRDRKANEGKPLFPWNVSQYPFCYPKTRKPTHTERLPFTDGHLAYTLNVISSRVHQVCSGRGRKKQNTKTQNCHTSPKTKTFGVKKRKRAELFKMLGTKQPCTFHCYRSWTPFTSALARPKLGSCHHYLCFAALLLWLLARRLLGLLLSTDEASPSHLMFFLARRASTSAFWKWTLSFCYRTSSQGDKRLSFFKPLTIISYFLLFQNSSTYRN